MIRADSLLGLGGHLDMARIEELVGALTTIWRECCGLDPGLLEEDLERCRKWFDPVAQGQRLRRQLSTLPVISKIVRDPGEPLTIRVGDDRCLVTPEGRCALDLLSGLHKDPAGHVIGDAQLVRYDRILGQLYRDWSRHRLSSVVKLLSGQEKPLQLAAAGVTLAILVNRSTSPARALKRFPEGQERDVIDDAFFAVAAAFSKTLFPTQRPTRDPRLISGWMLYEARRRLGDHVLVVESARPDKDARVWIVEESEARVLDIVARDLARGYSTRIRSEAVSSAFDALVKAFRSQTPRLAGFGMAHERPTNTERIRKTLLARYLKHAER
jgi:hypothetical protein